VGLPAAWLQAELVQPVLEGLQPLAFTRLDRLQQVGAVEEPRGEQGLRGELRFRPQAVGGLEGSTSTGRPRPQERSDSAISQPVPEPRRGLALRAGGPVRIAREVQLKPTWIAAPFCCSTSGVISPPPSPPGPGPALGTSRSPSRPPPPVYPRRHGGGSSERRGPAPTGPRRRLHSFGPRPAPPQRPALAVDGDERDQASRAGAALLGGPSTASASSAPRRVEADRVGVREVRGVGRGSAARPARRGPRSALRPTRGAPAWWTRRSAVDPQRLGTPSRPPRRGPAAGAGRRG
jgi:hypothetical protein